MMALLILALRMMVRWLFGRLPGGGWSAEADVLSEEAPAGWTDAGWWARVRGLPALRVDCAALFFVLR
jgi:hypothetical protein